VSWNAHLSADMLRQDIVSKMKEGVDFDITGHYDHRTQELVFKVSDTPTEGTKTWVALSKHSKPGAGT
jgi:hypothetical protein